MGLGFVVLASTIVVKAASIGFVASIATSPVALPSRRRFLDSNKASLSHLIKLGIGPQSESLAQLNNDFDLLEQHIETGWHDSSVFAAAIRISAWKFAEHLHGAATGTARLVVHGTQTVTENFRRSFLRMFNYPPDDNPKT